MNRGSAPQAGFLGKHPALGAALDVALPLMLAEAGVRVLVHFDVFPYRNFPTTRKPSFWDDVNPDFGVWHVPNSSMRQRKSCFDVTYHTNSWGMRDPERTLHSEAAERVVVLGDSFVEGYGVARGQRFTDRLERRTGVEHLDFGTAGDFGSIQEWLCYKTLACRFDHSKVLLFFVPANDFRDNRPDTFPPDRYRPYLRPSDDGMEVVHPVSFEDRRRVTWNAWQRVGNVISNRCYLVNFLRAGPPRIRKKIALKLKPPRPSYGNWSEDDLETLLYTYRQIVELAAGRPVYIFAIPIGTDFADAMAGGNALRRMQEVGDRCRAWPGVHFTDLLPFFLKDARAHGRTERDYRLECDSHWNARGHAVAADVVWQVVWAD